MNNDIGPPRRPLGTPRVGPVTTGSFHPEAPQAPQTDLEAKVEREFGPTSEDAPAQSAVPAGPKPKLMKLLPASFAKHHWTKWQVLIAAAVVLLVLAAGATSYIILTHYKPAVKHPAAIKIVPPKPKTVASTLTGLQVDPSVNQRPVTAVMIENAVDARPQSGLDQAGIVFEALAEGGVTRFMALYQDTQPDYLGPVRSARPYYIQWALGFDAAYAHVGGSADALSDITAWGVKDMNQFYNSSAFERISSRDAPHNVYTSADQLNTLEQSKGYTSSTYTGFVRKADAPAKVPTVTSVDVSLSNFYYDSHWDYDAASNSYKRSEQGTPHTELHQDGTQAQITSKVVVVMIIPEQNGVLDASGAYYADYATIGSGQALVFQDGGMTTGTWSKTSNTAQITFTDAAGKPLALNAGQTWLVAEPLLSNVTYK